MVIDGRQVLKGSLSVVDFEGERIRLPVQVVKSAEHPRLAGEDPVECWLLVVTPGRYRLVAQPAETLTGDLLRIVDEIEDTLTTGEVLDRTENNARDGIQARLIPCKVSPSQAGWRINFPKEAKELVSEKNEDRSFVYVMIVAGFIEIWFPDTLRRALSGPIPEILP
ncbi:MAG TPA: hypothetical protein VG204_02440 [Terriglobia bacterium]|nr:hypothetical protein [Terriglobia bacterium]